MATSPEEVTNLVKSFWPDFPIHEEFLKRPSAEFVQNFYYTFLSEVDEKIALLLSEDNCNLNEYAEFKDFDDAVYLYKRAYSLFKKCNYDSKMFYLSDIYNPTPKRTVFLIKVNTHFAIFINNNIEDLMKIVNENFEKSEKSRHLEMLLQQCLSDVNENAERIARQENTNVKQKERRENVRRKYEEMLAEKKVQEKAQSEKRSEVKKRKQEIDCLKYQLQLSEAEEKKLQQQVVTSEHFVALKETEKCLEDERDQLDTEDLTMDDGIDLQKQMLDNLEECAEVLESVHFDSLNLDQLQDAKKKLDVQKFAVKHKENQLTKARDAEASKVLLKQESTEKLEELKKFEIEAENDLAQSVRHLEMAHRDKLKESVENKEKYYKLKTGIQKVEEAIEAIEMEEEQSKKAFMAQYKRILATSRVTMNKFDQFLIDIIEMDKKVCTNFRM